MEHGRSKEKRSDCPLVTLGLVLDGSGFVRRSEVFEGNAAEGKTLEQMLKELEAPVGALVMDAGIATESNLSWLGEHGYRYVVISRNAPANSKRKRRSPLEPPLATAFIFSVLMTMNNSKCGCIATPNSADKKSRPSISAFAHVSRPDCKKSPMAWPSRALKNAWPNCKNASAGSKKKVTA